MAFSGIGIAAITGHLSIARSSLNPFSAFGGATVVLNSGSNRVVSGRTHEGLTRSAGEIAAHVKPVNFRPGARLPTRKPCCPNCGVVDSIKPQKVKRRRRQACRGARHDWQAYQLDNDKLSTFSFVVIVRMENGTLRTIHENNVPFSIGEASSWSNARSFHWVD